MIELSVLQNKPLTAILRHINGEDYSSNIELFERGKTIFFPGDPADKIYFLLKGAVKLSLVYEAGDEITVALLRENSVFGVFSLIAGQKSDRFYHAVAFSAVELLSAPTNRVEEALKNNSDLSILMLKGLSSRILQTEMMIETLAHRDMGSRLVSFLLILCRDFGVPVSDGIHIDLKLSHPDGLLGDVEKVYELIGPIPINVLYNYFVGDPEQAYSAMKPMLDLLKKQEKNSESEE